MYLSDLGHNSNLLQWNTQLAALGYILTTLGYCISVVWGKGTHLPSACQKLHTAQ